MAQTPSVPAGEDEQAVVVVAADSELEPEPAEDADLEPEAEPEAEPDLAEPADSEPTPEPEAAAPEPAPVVTATPPAPLPARPSWSFSGVAVSKATAVSGESVTVTPRVSGDLEGATYNYVWSRNGSWAKGEWGSTALSSGSYTTSATGTFCQARPGTYTVYVDVLDRAGEKRTLSTTVRVVAPSWSFSGVAVSKAAVVSGESVTVTPRVSGDLEGATYNYVWSRNGSWAKGEWGSTALSTGSYTTSATGTFDQRRPGTYTVYVDVLDRAGTKRTLSTTVRVIGPSWSFSAVAVSKAAVVSGESVTVTPRVSGDLSGATYNYVWSRNGSWARGEWGSTALSTGSYTTSATGAFDQRRPGTYTVYVDVLDRAGTKRTLSTTVRVVAPSWSFSGVAVSPSRMSLGSSATIAPKVSGDLAGATYNYVWSRNGSWAKGEWGSTALSSGSYTTSATGTFDQRRPGTYTVYVDVLDRAGQKRTLSTTVTVIDDTWALNGVATSPTGTVAPGTKVTITPKVTGDLAGATYNYVWSRNGSWAKGEWGSTALSSGSYTTSSTGSLTLARPGTYTIYVDVLSKYGEKRTVSTTVTVWGVNGVGFWSSDGGASWTAAANPSTVPANSGTKYRFRWASLSGARTGVLKDWSDAASVQMTAAQLGHDDGICRIYLDVKYPNGSTATYDTGTLPGKSGYQNPSDYPQVSRYRVQLPSYCTGYWTFVHANQVNINASRNDCIETMIGVAYEYMRAGTPWVDNHCSYPGSTIDCSGMVMEGLYACGMSLDRTRGGDFNPYTKYYQNPSFVNTWRANGTFRAVNINNVQRGDLIYYDGHVAIYLGGGKIIDAHPGTNVSVRSMYAPGKIVGAARPFI